MSREKSTLEAGLRPDIDELATKIFTEGAMGEIPGLHLALCGLTPAMHSYLNERLAQMHGRGKERATSLDVIAKKAGSSACKGVDFA